MSNNPRKQRHRFPPPSHWLLLMKVVIALGRIVSFVMWLCRVWD